MNRREILVAGLGGAAFAGWAMAGSRRPSPNVRRLSRLQTGETVNLRDYCIADGRAIDTQRYQELIDLRPAAIRYPADAVLMLDEQIQLQGEQTHQFATGARIDADVGDFALIGMGKTGQNMAALIRAIPRYARTVFLDAVPAVRSGDIVTLCDVTDPKNIKVDINVVERLDGTVVMLRHPVGRPFDNLSGFRIYHLYAPVRALQFDGKVIGTNHHQSGGFLRFVNAIDAQVRGMTIADAGYIGVSFESSIGGRFQNLTIKDAGASGLGFRAAKAIVVDRFAALNVRADEALTFYDNVSQVTATNISIRQYLFDDRKHGSNAGNDILVDMLCSNINLSNIDCVGSSTYNVMFNNQSDNCSIDNFVLSHSNLGGIRISDRCRNIKVGKGQIFRVVDTFDAEANKPVSAISIGASCIGTTVSPDITYDRIATGRRIGEWHELTR